MKIILFIKIEEIIRNEFRHISVKVTFAFMRSLKCSTRYSKKINIPRVFLDWTIGSRKNL